MGRRCIRVRKSRGSKTRAGRGGYRRDDHFSLADSRKSQDEMVRKFLDQQKLRGARQPEGVEA